VERRGWEHFQARGCATCHVGKLLGGQSFERMGRTGDYFAARGRQLTAADDGRSNVTHEKVDRHRFKVPTLRNIALTHPYFHDGSAADLPVAVRAMGTYMCGTRLPEPEVAAIVQFLGTLTGTWEGRPLAP
jgi:cytochrome c peroxidase